VVGLGSTELVSLVVFAVILIGIWVSRSRRKREGENPPEDDPGW
jgi:hypothetical protein